MILTTSWDDGHPLDLRLAELLARHGLPATFYVPVENPERPLLSPDQIRQVAQAGFEIGGHTFHHTRLLNVTLETANEEIVSGKAALEQLLGNPVVSFCYVGGQHSPALAALVQRAGFAGARTTARYRLWQPSSMADRFAAPTTMVARPLTRREDALQVYSSGRVDSLLHALAGDARDIVKTARRWLDRAARQGGVWHLWGHSWEIEKFCLWPQLDTVLTLASETRGQARWLTNGELFTECAAGQP